jgi:putative membrane protein
VIGRDDHAAIEAIEKEIGEAEKHTTGEIVIVLTGAASDYIFSYLAMLVLICSVLLPALIAGIAMFESEIGIGEVMTASFMQVVLLVIGSIAGLRSPKLRAAVTPRGYRHRLAHQLAREQFYSRGLRHTDGGTGVLIFVSFLDRYVEVIADKGIADKVNQAVWQDTVDYLRQNLASGNLLSGFTGAIQRVSRVLSEHFPGTKEKDQIPNRMFIL